MVQEELGEGVDGINGLESDGSILGPQQVRAKDNSQVSVGHLVLVTLGRNLWREIRAAAGPQTQLPRPATGYQSSRGRCSSLLSGERQTHLHQEGSKETKHLVVLLGQRLEDLQRHLHSLALINVYEEWGPGLQGPKAGWLRQPSHKTRGETLTKPACSESSTDQQKQLRPGMGEGTH